LITHPIGIVESKNKHITDIPSLFLAQLNERLSALFTSTGEVNPGTFRYSIYPNPVTREVHIAYTLSKNSSVELAFFDVSGKNVKNCISQAFQPQGSYNKSFDVSGLKPGIYCARLLVDGSATSSKLIIQ
jgi:hypothetical protein